ncbi:MAG: hypothetical protein AAF738_06910, partial [Bacteroidota bacterium]
AQASLYYSTFSNPERLLERGQYDAAIDKTVRKLIGKKRKKYKHVIALETAFRKANTRDMNAINRLERTAQANPQNWSRIFDLASDIERRQAKVEPLLPLRDKNGFRANFRFVKTSIILDDARANAAAHCYAQAQNFLNAAYQGDKAAARAAYSRLREIDKYYSSYKNKKALLKEALTLGQVHIALRMNNRTYQRLPNRFEQQLFGFNTQQLNTSWEQFHINPTSQTMDYEVVLQIQRVDISPERIVERSYVDEKEILDGAEDLLDNNGNVVTDSLGNALQVPRKILVEALVSHVAQHKAADIQAELEYYDVRTGELLQRRPLSAEVVFEHEAGDFSGDRRALSSESCRLIGGSPSIFPSDGEMLLDAAHTLRTSMRSDMRRMNFLLD